MIRFASTRYDFGRVEVGKILKHEFVFTNAGDQVLLITNVQSSCGCVPAGKWTRKLDPGQAGTIPIELYTVNFANGPVAKSVSVSNNDPVQPLVTLQIKGEVWRPVEAIPAGVGFVGLPDFMSNSVKRVRIVNHEEKPLILGEPVSSSRVFAVKLSTNQPGQEYELAIRVVPPLGSGNSFGKITMKTSSTKIPVLIVDAWAVPQPAVSALPSKITVPAGVLTNKLTGNVAIRCLDTNRLVLSEPSLNVPDVDMQLHEIQPGRHFSVVLTFPIGFQVPEGKRVELRIKSNHPRYPVIIVPIESQPTLPPAIVPQSSTTAPARR